MKPMNPKQARVTTVAGLVGVTVFSALAQTTGGGSGLDYTESITAFKGDMTTFLQTNGPILLGALVIMLAFGLVWRLVKRAANSV